MTLDSFLQAIVDDPHCAATTWLVLADWLEDQGDPRAELVRLMYQPDYRHDLSAEQRDERVRELLTSGVGPVAPTLVNSIGMKLVLIPSGTFLMGSPYGEGLGDEDPWHEVRITRPFFLSVYQVTQEEYQKVMGQNPSWFSATGYRKHMLTHLETKTFPVEYVSWEEVNEFCEALSNLPTEKAASRTYQLPTEAQWEYSCRGSSELHSPFHFGDSLSLIQANFYGTVDGGGANGSPLGRPCSVGSFCPNAFGLFDMHGNVWEWCLDWYDTLFYSKSKKHDPQGPRSGNSRVLRGGAWNSHDCNCRTARRHKSSPGNRQDCYGFRVTCSQESRPS